MAKLAILLALCSMLALRHVSAFHAANVADNEEQQLCREQITMQKNMENCQKYLSLGHQSHLESLNQCCTELRNIDHLCRCQAVNHAFTLQRGQGDLEGLQRRAAENLPSRCNLSPHQCQIESIWA